MEIVLKAMGQAIGKTVAIAEIIKVDVLFFITSASYFSVFSLLDLVVL